MKIHLEIIPTPMVSGFTLMANPNLSLLKENKTIRISTHLVSKTRVCTSFQLGECSKKINFAIDGFKTFEKTEFNYFSGQENTSNYFILSKKQNREVYIEYVKKVIEKVVTEYFKIELDEITIHLEEPKF